MYSPAQHAADYVAALHRPQRVGNYGRGPGAFAGGALRRPWPQLEVGGTWIEEYQPGVLPAVTRNRAVASAGKWAQKHRPSMRITSEFTARGVQITRVK